MKGPHILRNLEGVFDKVYQIFQDKDKKLCHFAIFLKQGGEVDF